jgi:inner membrane protein
MPSVIGHLLAGYAAGRTLSSNSSGKFISIVLFCSVLPDFDVLSFQFGIPYESIWGHRGFSHSLFFGLIAGAFFSFLFYTKKEWTRYALIFSFIIILHALLDGLTNGGLGCGYLIPFDSTRYFFPRQVIQVSPFGLQLFFSERGVKVLQSELLWIGIPSLTLLLIGRLMRYFNAQRRTAA